VDGGRLYKYERPHNPWLNICLEECPSGFDVAVGGICSSNDVSWSFSFNDLVTEKTDQANDHEVMIVGGVSTGKF
jgi:hypothetical protein